MDYCGIAYVEISKNLLPVPQEWLAEPIYGGVAWERLSPDIDMGSLETKVRNRDFSAAKLELFGARMFMYYAFSSDLRAVAALCSVPKPYETRDGSIVIPHSSAENFSGLTQLIGLGDHFEAWTDADRTCMMAYLNAAFHR